MISLFHADLFIEKNVGTPEQQKELKDFLKDNKELLATHRKLRSLKYKHWRQIRLLEQTLLGLITINPIYIHN